MSDRNATDRNDGTWVIPPVSYVEPDRRSCAFCGRPIARQYWQSAPDGTIRSFCDPSHSDLYLSYWLPLYGSQR
jgi:hypothetical protein